LTLLLVFLSIVGGSAHRIVLNGSRNGTLHTASRVGYLYSFTR
jgi:hypothetical protein